MKKDYIKLLILLTEFKCSGIIPEKYAREVDQHIEFLNSEIASSIETENSKTGLSKIIEFIYKIFKGP
jgi:hypothetical protein